jgi:hypothetical protein
MIGVICVCLCACGKRPTRHIDDRAAIIDSSDLTRFEDYLAQLERESGIDIRFLFVDSVPAGTLNDFAVREARALGIGQHLDRHGVLLAYDAGHQQLRIEVGPTLQHIFTDRFIGYLMRDHVRSFFAAGNPGFGLRLTMFMLHARVRRAALGEDYDPRAADFVEDRRRLASGGGATAAGMRDPNRSAGFLNRLASQEARDLLRPQPTVEQAYRVYLAWLQRGSLETDVPLFTPATQAYLGRFPMTPAFADYLLFLEYGHAYEIVEHDSLAMLYFTDDPLSSPHFFRKAAAGWQVDIFADVRHSHEYVGGRWTWTITLRDDDISQTFAHRFFRIHEYIRVVGGDNRPIPVAATAQPAPDSLVDTLGSERLTVTEASQRIARLHGKPVVVLLYVNWSTKTRELFPQIVKFLRRCESSGVAIAAFSTDGTPEGVLQLPGFLRQHDAPFPPIAIYPWPSGGLSKAMAVHGIQIGSSWRAPLVALLDKDGHAIAQAQGITQGATLELGQVEKACSA